MEMISPDRQAKLKATKQAFSEERRKKRENIDNEFSSIDEKQRFRYRGSQVVRRSPLPSPQPAINSQLERTRANQEKLSAPRQQQQQQQRSTAEENTQLTYRQQRLSEVFVQFDYDESGSIETHELLLLGQERRSTLL